MKGSVETTGTSGVNAFISYSSRDRAAALDLKLLLERQGCTVWLDIFDIQPTSLLSGELSQNIDRADVMCLLLSPTSVASKWVNQEIDHALAGRSSGLRVLPLILRPCSIPDRLADIVAIDATAGLQDDVVRLRLVRWITGVDSPDDGVLLDATRRSLIAAQEKQADADRAMPGVRASLDHVRNEPIRRVAISLEADSFPQIPGAVLELKLTFDQLFSEPMSVYFARFREGRTWPEEFRLPEPSYRQFFGKNVTRIQATFRWFDQVRELEQVVDGTDLGDLPATWDLELDGTEFRPASAGIHLPQRLEIPPIRRLSSPPNGFELIVHDPTTKTASAVDPARADIDLVVKAGYSEREPSNLTLYRTRHTLDEQAILQSHSVVDIAGSVEQEAVLGLYIQTLPAATAHVDRMERVEQLLASDTAATDEERALLAKLIFGRAALASVRAQHQDALNGYMKVANLLQSAVFGGRATYREAVLLYQACRSVLGYFLSRDKAAGAAEYLDSAIAVAGRLRELDPDEPDYRRIWADAMVQAARIYQATGRAEDAATALRDRVDTFRALATEMPSADRNDDARTTIADSLVLASRWEMEAMLPTNDWRHELDPEKDAAEWESLLDPGRSDVWLRPTTLTGWPTHLATSELLRYECMVRDGWSDAPELASAGREVVHIYRGPSPVEWLVVSFMDKADGASDMRNWVDPIVAISGFPILEMQSASDPSPELVDWDYEGRDRELAKRLGADEAHRFQGMAKLVQPGAVRLARLYIVLARRETLAWKVALSIESACPPNMPASMVDANDHVRAGVTFGSLRLR